MKRVISVPKHHPLSKTTIYGESDLNKTIEIICEIINDNSKYNIYNLSVDNSNFSWRNIAFDINNYDIMNFNIKLWKQNDKLLIELNLSSGDRFSWNKLYQHILQFFDINCTNVKVLTEEKKQLINLTTSDIKKINKLINCPFDDVKLNGLIELSKLSKNEKNFDLISKKSLQYILKDLSFDNIIIQYYSIIILKNLIEFNSEYFISFNILNKIKDLLKKYKVFDGYNYELYSNLFSIYNLIN